MCVSSGKGKASFLMFVFLPCLPFSTIPPFPNPNPQPPTSSDITIVLGDRKVFGHRYVLAARSRSWSKDETLTSTSELDLSHMTSYVAGLMLRWIYTDNITLPSEQGAMIELLSASNIYNLVQLKEKWVHV